MAKKEKDTIVDGKGIGAFGVKKGVLLEVKYKKSKIQLSRETGLIWFDIESAHGLSLAPENHKSLNNKEITSWIAENLKEKPIEIISHVKLGLTLELKRKLQKCSELLYQIEPELVPLLEKFVKAFPDNVGNDSELFELIRTTINRIFANPAIYQPSSKEMVILVQEVTKEVRNFTAELMSHFGFHRSIIIPVLGERPDDRLMKVSGVRRGLKGSEFLSSTTICTIFNVGLYDTSKRIVMKQADVMITE